MLSVFSSSTAFLAPACTTSYQGCTTLGTKMKVSGLATGLMRSPWSKARAPPPQATLPIRAPARIVPIVRLIGVSPVDTDCAANLCSRHDKAAIDVDRLSRDVGGILASEEGDEAGDIRSGPCAAHWDVA